MAAIQETDNYMVDEFRANYSQRLLTPEAVLARVDHSIIVSQVACGARLLTPGDIQGKPRQWLIGRCGLVSWIPEEGQHGLALINTMTDSLYDSLRQELPHLLSKSLGGQPYERRGLVFYIPLSRIDEYLPGIDLSLFKAVEVQLTEPQAQE